jgi:hypothetical protein
LGHHEPARLIYPGSHFLTTAHDLHRARRKPLEPYFSRLGIEQLEPTIHELVEKIIRRFVALEGTGAIVRLDHVMLCYTGDMVKTTPIRFRHAPPKPVLSTTFNSVLDMFWLSKEPFISPL